MDWEAVIGLEVHVQLNTKSKIFSGASTTFGANPNTQACLIDLGFPGILPVINDDVINMAIKFGLAIDAAIADYAVFERKNYFYPDLPKGYQISQYELPIVKQGKLTINLENSSKTIGITRAHLEEDAGKSLHEEFHGLTGLDFNRAGTPLLEIVSEPEIHTAAEAVAYLKALHSIVRYLEISDANMQEGSFRCDANVSVRQVGATKLGTRTEIKNLNSFRFIEKAINHEIERQIDLIEAGQSIVQETRLYDADRDETRPMRSKEEANDYRYFPDPDILPIRVSDDLIATIRAELPELPRTKVQRFMNQYQLNEYDADILSSQKAIADYFEAVVVSANCQAKLAANWVSGELLGALNKANLTIESSPISSEQLAQLLMRIEDKTISGKIAKKIFEILWQEGGEPDRIIQDHGLEQVTDLALIKQIIDKVIAENPEQVAQYHAGKEKVFGFFVGQVMQLSKGKANPQQVNDILKEKLR